jgi:hypothetical protein
MLNLRFLRALTLSLALFAQQAQAQTLPIPDTDPGGTHGTFKWWVDNILNPILGTFTQKSYFASGRPWCDPRQLPSGAAQGDGVTDDDAAFTSCLSTLAALSPTTGGEIRASPGHYCLQAGTFEAALKASSVTIDIIGSGAGPTMLDTCGADVDLVYLNANHSLIRDIQLTGAPFTTNSAHNALTFNCTECEAHNVLGAGGYYGFLSTPLAADAKVEDSNLHNSYGAAFIELQGVTYLKRVKGDVGGGACAAPPVAWSAALSVSTGECATTQGYIIKYNVGGTTGTAAPTLAVYGTQFADGTATAHLDAPVGAYTLEAQQQGSYSAFGDYSGPTAYGIHVTNGGALFSTEDTVGNNLTGGVLVDSGQASLVNDLFSGCIASGCKNVTVNGSAIGVAIGGNTQLGGSAIAIEYDAGTYLKVTGARIGSTATGINIGTANLSNISVIGNIFGTSAQTLATGIAFINGTSDNVELWGNTFQYTTTPLTGTITGTHNSIEKAGAASLASLTLANPLSVASGGTGNATAAVHSIPVSEGTSAQNAVGPCTTSQVIIGQGSSTDPACGPVPVAALPAGLSTSTACTPWTPTDQSGGGLTFSAWNAEVCQVQNSVTIFYSITYPINSDTTHSAAISLPVPVPNQSYAFVKSQPAAAVGATNVILNTVQNSSPGKATITQVNNTSALTNAALTGATISGSMTYPAN